MEMDTKILQMHNNTVWSEYDVCIHTTIPPDQTGHVVMAVARHKEVDNKLIYSGVLHHLW